MTWNTVLGSLIAHFIEKFHEAAPPLFHVSYLKIAALNAGLEQRMVHPI
jgi:hypothetical protein